MQELMVDIFDLHRCGMRGDDNNRWAFAAMGVAVQMAPFKAYRWGKSTWSMKEDVLGE